MLANDVIYTELRRLGDLTFKLAAEVRDLSARLAVVEAGAPPSSASEIEAVGSSQLPRASA
jgi:hypothetical protein